MTQEIRRNKKVIKDWPLKKLKERFTVAFFDSDKNCPNRPKALDRWRRALLMQLDISRELERRGYKPVRVTTIEFRRIK